MAAKRSKKDPTTPLAPPASEPAAATTKTGGRKARSAEAGGSPAVETKKPKGRAKRIVEAFAEILQTVGADVVPTGKVEVDVPRAVRKAAPSAASGAKKASKTSSVKPKAAPRSSVKAGASSGPPGFVTRLNSETDTETGIRQRAEGRADRDQERKPTPTDEASHFDTKPTPAAASVAPEQRIATAESADAASADSAVDLRDVEPQHSSRHADPVIDPHAMRPHRVEQVQPEIEIRRAVPNDSLLSDWDIYLFNEGSHHRLWEKLGAHMMERDGVAGTNFAVWAPNARYVSVIGDFNGWDNGSHPLTLRGSSGIWEGFVPEARKGAKYKFHIASQFNNYSVDKADPFGVHHETPPHTGSVVWDLDYEWRDAAWMASRHERNSCDAPLSIYEVHLGSWMRTTGDDGSERSLSYRELAQPLAEYVQKMNFTHVEFLPVMEHPFFGSWGYQCTGFFAPSSRFGTPQDFKYLVDVLHEYGVGVILDWVPSHFPTDEHGLAYFDGTHLFEHADPRQGFHPDWGSLIFNYGRNEVRSFLLSSALYWLGEYHADGLRVDAVASMLYLDYSRRAGEWIPNDFGGRENVEAIAFLRRMNEDVYKVHPDVQVIAEESTAWPMVSRPTYIGGLGFGMKWDMGWMHDSLRYFSKDPVHRKYHHNDLTFRMMYAFTENFVLPLSHDEVVHGKGSLIGKMPGDDWQKFANLRLLFAHMYCQPGKKLVFMGGEIAQWPEWNHDGSLDWAALQYLPHSGMQRWVEDLNKAYRDIPSFHELDLSSEGFEWIDCCDSENSIVSIMRRSKTHPDEVLICVLNFTPLPRHNYQIGVPRGGHWTEVLNSDAPIYGGSGQGNLGGVDASPVPLHGRRWSVNLTIPPLGAVFLLSHEETEELASGAAIGTELAS